MAMIEVKNLTFIYPTAEQPALRDVFFAIERSEFCVLCGKSGCGKSTLLRQLKKNLIPYGERSGFALYNGTEIAALSDHISDAAGDMAATAAKKAGDAAEQLSETLTEVADEAREASDKIKEKNGFWSIFAGKKKEETEAQKKEESAPAEAETKTEDKASADPADTAKSDASEE